MKLYKPKTWHGRWLLRGVIMNVVLVVTISAFYCEELWRGEHAWNRYKAEAKARGTKLTIAEFIRPPIKDEDNFAAIPLFQDLFDTNKTSTTDPFEMPRPNITNRTYVLGQPTDFVAWRDHFASEGFFTNTTADATNDVLEALKVFDADLAHLRAAASRPDCRFPVDWSKGVSVQIPHITTCMSAARVLRLRIAAELAAGKSAEAYDDFKLGLRIYRALEPEPVLISGLINISILQQVRDAVHEGLVTGRWSPAEIVAIEKDLAPLHVVADCESTLQGERTFQNDVVERMRAGTLVGLFDTFRLGTFSYDYNREKMVMAVFPRGWLRQNELLINKFYDAEIGRLDIHRNKISSSPDFMKIRSDLGCDGPVAEYVFFLVDLLMPSVDSIFKRFAAAATQTEMAKTACALELYRIPVGAYPEKLDALVPQFLPSVPLDPVEGKPLHYERQPGGGYVLWSPDLEHRFPELAATNAPPVSTNFPDTKEEEWVWRQPK